MQSRPGSLLLLALLLPVFLVSQDGPTTEFGRISDEDRKMLVLASDTTAEAYVLYDHLDLDYEYSDLKGPILVERYHRRLKLFKPSAYERANITITYDRSYRSIGDVEALVQLPEGGTIVLGNEDFINQTESGTRVTLKFTFPRLTPGATVEYRYTRRTDGILIPTPYTFQEDIPVRWAEYTAMIPAYYDYVSLGRPGRYHINETEIVKRQWGPEFSIQAYSNNNKLDHTRVRWAMKDLDAYRYQPYSNNFVDYLPRVRLQLRGVQYPGRPLSKVFSSWEETVTELQDRKDFGRYYRNKSNYGKLWKEAEPLIAGQPDARSKIEAAYRFVIDRYRWNGRYGILATDSPNSTFDAGGGNSADLNIALLSLLNEAGIEADPLLVSLRDEGAPIEQYPMLDQFDHLMVYTEVDGKPLLLDANDADRPAGLPRLVALNHRGWVANKDAPRWVDISVAPAESTIMAVMDVAADGQSTTHLRARLDSYYAFEARGKLRAMESASDAPLSRQIIKQYPEASILEAEHETTEASSADRLSLEARLSVPAGQALSDFLYVQPVLLPMIEADLADVETRLYPIDFPHPTTQRYIAQIKLPEGYIIDEVPASVRLKAEDGSITASYVTSYSEALRMLNLNFSLEVSRTLYAAEEYAGLRDMFRRIIDLQQAPIVLKKVAK
jgi:transglutaminase-like putative cysteine protease